MHDVSVLTRWAPTTLAIFLAAGIATAAAAPRFASADSIAPEQPAVFDCEVDCDDLGGDELGQHTAELANPGTNERADGSHEDEWPGACNGWTCVEWHGEEPGQPCNPPAQCTCTEWLSPRHPSCGSFAIAEQLEHAVLAGDLTRARALAKESPMVVLVPERHAVQVIGCAGEVMAHFGLTGGDFAVFADSE